MATLRAALAGPVSPVVARAVITVLGARRAGRAARAVVSAALTPGRPRACRATTPHGQAAAGREGGRVPGAPFFGNASLPTPPYETRLSVALVTEWARKAGQGKKCMVEPWPVDAVLMGAPCGRVRPPSRPGPAREVAGRGCVVPASKEESAEVMVTPKRPCPPLPRAGFSAET